MNRKALAYIMLVLKCILYGISILFTGRLLDAGGTAEILAFRFTISAVVFLLLRTLGIIKINFKGKNLKPLMFAALFEPVLYFIFETLGIKYTSTITAGIILALAPIVAGAAEMLILKEKTNTMQKLFMLLGIIGAVVIVFCSEQGENKDSIIGIIFMAIAMASGGFFLASSRKSSQEFSTMEITYFMVWTGAIIFNCINLALNFLRGGMGTYFALLADPMNVAQLVFLAIVCSIIATSMGNFAVSEIQASTVSTIGGLTTVVTVLSGVFVKGEIFTLYHLVGMVLILAGAVGVAYTKEGKKAENKFMEGRM